LGLPLLCGVKLEISPVFAYVGRMTTQAVEPIPTQANPTARPETDIDTLGLRIEVGFRDAAGEAVHQALSQGVPVATLVDGRVAWLHPDGVIRPHSEPVAARHVA
jgi:hypothetical protein